MYTFISNTGKERVIKGQKGRVFTYLMASIIEWATSLLGDNSTLSESEASEKFEALCCTYDERTGARQLRAEEVIEMMRGGEVIILDIRHGNEHEVSCIPTAKNIEPEFSWLGSFRLKTPLPDNFAANKTLVCACTAGLRSGLAAVQLEKSLGRPIYNLHGGIIAWVNAGGRVIQPTTGEITENVHALNIIL